MKVRWLGHASFLISTGDGKRILTDPYTPGSYDGAVGYGRIEDVVDIAAVSHSHDDHCGTDELVGSPQIVKEPGEHTVMGITFTGVSTHHDRQGGAERGENTIFAFEADGVRVCHLGDLGHVLSEEDVLSIGNVDLLLIPVGGHFTIDADEATRVVEQLKPRLVIPMHYKTEALGFPIEGVDRFLQGKDRVRRVEGAELEVTRDNLPRETEIIVLQHAL
jgi:L-ascorbate metabolism protein UlaG (beta-lactamase superfamily)